VNEERIRTTVVLDKKLHSKMTEIAKFERRSFSQQAQFLLELGVHEWDATREMEKSQ
jgi:SAM-dependent MidA family methyltransferase